MNESKKRVHLVSKEDSLSLFANAQVTARVSGEKEVSVMDWTARPASVRIGGSMEQMGQADALERLADGRPLRSRCTSSRAAKDEGLRGLYLALLPTIFRKKTINLRSIV